MELQSKLLEPDQLVGRKAVQSVIVETEFLIDFLQTRDSPSTLRQVLSKALCYTTVVQISEVLAQCTSTSQRDAALAMCSLVRPLGVPPRYALNISFYLQKLAELGQEEPLRFALSASISQFSKVPVLTVQYESLYSRLDIPTIKPESLRS